MIIINVTYCHSWLTLKDISLNVRNSLKEQFEKVSIIIISMGHCILRLLSSTAQTLGLIGVANTIIIIFIIFKA